MADGIYVGMTAAAARAEQLDSVADNLANAQTPGFKASRPAFHSFLVPGVARGDKAYTAAVDTGTDRSAGPVQPTGFPLDVVPDAGAMLAVQLAGGERAFTRNGRIELGADGILRAAGRPVLGVGGDPIHVPPGPPPSIGPDGTVRVGEARIDRLAAFRIDGDLARVGASLFVAKPSAIAAPVETRLRVGGLEMGNATPLEAAVQMVSAQRHFEAAIQAVQTYRRMDDRAVAVGLVR